MGAVKEAVADLSTAAVTLAELTSSDIRFVLTFEPGAGYRWYLPNPWGPSEQEDWIFHALRSGGHSSSLEATIEQLATAARLEFPDSDFAKGPR